MDASTIFVLLILCAVVGFHVVRLARVWTVTPEDDLHRIRANLEGLVGDAGINKRVLGIVHNGATLGSRSQPPKRRYIVTLQAPDGSTEKRTVFIEAGLFGGGAMTVAPPGRWI